VSFNEHQLEISHGKDFSLEDGVEKVQLRNVCINANVHGIAFVSGTITIALYINYLSSTSIYVIMSITLHGI